MPKEKGSQLCPVCGGNGRQVVEVDDLHEGEYTDVKRAEDGQPLFDKDGNPLLDMKRVKTPRRSGEIIDCSRCQGTGLT